MEPDTIGHRLNLARALKLRHKLPEALQVIDEGLQREPRNVTALGVATMLSLEGGNVERAAGYSARLSKLAPDAPATLRVEGRVALAQKRYTDAVGYYDKAAAKGPDSSLIIERYQAARLAGLANAEQQLEQWLEKHPDDITVRVVLAEQLGARGQTAAAVKQYETVLQRAPNSLVALNNLAVIYQQQRFARGRARHQGVCRRARTAADRRYLRLAAGRQGKLDEGIEVLRKAAATPGATPEVRYHLAAALARDGQRDAALEMARKLKSERGNGYSGYRAKYVRMRKGFMERFFRTHQMRCGCDATKLTTSITQRCGDGDGSR